MELRPCIDIHDGIVKQIIGSSLIAENAIVNFAAKQDAAYFALLYKEMGLPGGHIIILNHQESKYYQDSLNQAKKALKAYPGGLMIGGGINCENAEYFVSAGASHVIVTSYVFEDGKINYDNLGRLIDTVGKERIVLDLSCRKSKNNECYYIMADRWQTFTDIQVNLENLHKLAPFCAEFLIHAVDVEGKSSGIDEELVGILGDYQGIPITYAGGVHNFSDLEKLRTLGKNRLNVTIGSALDLFGGTMRIKDVIKYIDIK